MYISIIIASLFIIHSITIKDDSHYLPDGEHEVYGVIKSVGLNEKDKGVIEINGKNYYFYSDTKLEEGSELKLVVEVSSPKNKTTKYGFDQTNYLLSKKILKIVYIKSFEVSKINIPLKHQYSNYIKAKNINITTNYIDALFLGDADSLGEEINNVYSMLNITHLIVISGLHINIIFYICKTILLKLGFSKKITSTFCVLLVNMYMAFLGFPTSVVRAVMLITFITLNSNFKNRFTVLDIFSFVCIINLLINPFNIFSTGFILSYIVTFALIASGYIINENDNYSLKTIKTCLLANLFTLPFVINISNSLNLLSVIYNLLYATLFVYIVIPMIFLVLIIPQLTIFSTFILTYLEKISIVLSKYQINIRFGNFDTLSGILYYVFLLVSLVLIETKNYKYLFIIFSYFFIHKFKYLIIQEAEIIFMDVGQGDTTIISDGGGCYMIIDAFNNSVSEVKSTGRTSIDYLFITHMDYDHAQRTNDFLKEFKVKNLVISKYFDIDSFEEFIDTKNLTNTELHLAKKSSRFDCGKITINTISPSLDWNDKNDNSLVLEVEMFKKKILFTGDISKEVEETLINEKLDIDILKIAHHGSSSSTSEDFIHSICPEIGIISAGRNNKFNHPHEEVLNTLYKNNILIYQTNVHGSISYKFNNKKGIYFQR